MTRQIVYACQTRKIASIYAPCVVACLLAGVMGMVGRAQTPPRPTGPTDEQITLSDIEVRRLVNRSNSSRE